MISLKKLFLLCSGMCFMFATTACITSQLWQPSAYHETFDQIYVAKDTSTIAVLGKKYHYIFTTSDKMKKLFAWKNNSKAHIILNYFKVDAANAITGSFSLNLQDSTLTDEDKSWLIANDLCTKYTCNVVEYLEGTRYAAESFPANLPATKLAQSYTVRIEEPISTSGKLARATITPITVLTDGALGIITGVVLTPLVAAQSLSSK